MDMQSDSSIRRRKIIFFCAVQFSFFSSLSKIVVPGSVFSGLQKDPGLSASVITALGSTYMYAYALSQFVLGMLSTRFGGVRILLVGGSFFAVGSILFPLFSNPIILLILRAVTGFGAGSIFIAIAKMIADLFPKRFALVLGIALFISYCGPVAGGTPTAWWVERFSWRPVLFVFGLIPMILMIPIWCFSKGVLKKVQSGSSFGALADVFRNKDGVLLFFCSSIVFGVYYAIVATMGQKSLEDFGKFSGIGASYVISAQAIIVALLNLLTDFIIKLCHNNVRILSIFASSLVLLGSLLGVAVFRFQLPGAMLAAVYLIAAVPAGFFTVYGTIAKDLYPDHLSGLAIALLNCFAFIAIAVQGNIAGFVLSSFEDTSGWQSGQRVYPPTAYMTLFAVFAFFAFFGLFAAWRIRFRKS